MANTGRKHYRVAKKNSQANPINGGIYIPKKNKQNVISIIICLLVLIFAKGLLIGFFAGRARY